MAALDLNTVRSTIEGRVATELASSAWLTSIFKPLRLCFSLSELNIIAKSDQN